MYTALVAGDVVSEVWRADLLRRVSSEKRRLPSSSQASHCFVVVEIYCVIKTALWRRDGSAVVSVPAKGYIHSRLVWDQRHRWELMICFTI